MSGTCFRPKGLCCSSACSHEPECDHEGCGTERTPWRRMYSGGEVVKEYPGGLFCLRCGWWLRETPRPAEWPEANEEKP